MSPDESTDSDANRDSDTAGEDKAHDVLLEGTRKLEEGADMAIEEFDKRVVDLLAWLLDTETRARIYIYLRQHAGSTSEEIAEGTGLYPSTVREAIVAMHEEDIVTRTKRASEGAGNNPYEYEAIPPSELVKQVASRVQDELNTVFCLDDHLAGRHDDDDTDAVKITIDD